jgi:DNA invertase Pin-like site-specific DNA recombinase
MSKGLRTISVNNPFKNTGGYDNTHSYMTGYAPDWSRKTAVLMRQSTKGADIFHRESRLRQENLFDTALEIRPDQNGAMVITCDEGSGVSGQKKIYERDKMLQAWDGILNGSLGTIIVAREDRLFRHRHLSQVGMFTEECQKHNVLVIVAGKRCYDFSRDDDLKTFIRKMEEAYAYLKHIEYMISMQAQKQQRGEWVGGAIIAPYAIDKIAQAAVKEQIKLLKSFGEIDIEITDEMSRAYRPVIYQPWLDISLDLFKKFRLFNFHTPRLMRYIEEKSCLFPYPIAAEKLKYLFKIHLKEVKGMGYTFNEPQSVERWIINPNHIGWMIVGKEEIGKTKSGQPIYEPIYMQDCFEGIISREEFEEYYIEIKGEDLNGNPVERVRQKTRFTRKHPTGAADTLLNRLFISEHYIVPRNSDRTYPYYICETRCYQPGRSEDTYSRKTLWSLPAKPIDRGLVDRLREIAECDKEMASRVEEYYNELAESRITETNLIQNDIAAIQRRIDHLDMLIKTPDMGFSVQQLKDFGEDQRKAYQDLEAAQRKMEQRRELQPSQIIPNFYRILGKAPGEFWKLDIDHQRKMLRKLIESIKIENMAPHIYILCLKWIQPVAKRPDIALIYRGTTLRNNDWTLEEEAWLRANYPTRDKLEIIQHFSERTWHVIQKRAFDLGVQRAIPRHMGSLLHRHLAYNDWIKTCEHSGVDYKSEKGQLVLDMLNYYAEEIGKKEIAFQWLHPADKIAASAINTEVTGTNIPYELEGIWSGLIHHAQVWQWQW